MKSPLRVVIESTLSGLDCSLDRSVHFNGWNSVYIEAWEWSDSLRYMRDSSLSSVQKVLMIWTKDKCSLCDPVSMSYIGIRTRRPAT
jgi:hypothetical protein